MTQLSKAAAAQTDTAPGHDVLRQYLTKMSEGFRRLGSSGGGWLMEEFVLREGIDCIAQPLPKRYVKRLPKQCFANARTLVRRARDLTYCEGFGWRAGLPLPLHHAWAIDHVYNVVDPTWDDPQDCTYVGVAIPRADLLANCGSMLLTASGVMRWEYMVRRCPPLRRLLDATKRREVSPAT